jgi:ABC-2 type transport system permease protein
MTPAIAIARRNVRAAVREPALWAPPIAFPLFSLAALAGGLSGLVGVRGFGYPAGYTVFQFAFTVVQVSCFGGVFLGFAVAADFESGFMRRLMLATAGRSAIVVGFCIVGLVRYLLTLLVVTAAAVAAGMRMPATPAELAGVVVLGALVNLASFLLGCGIAMRMRSLSAGPLMLVPVFSLLFLAPVYVPLELLTGWLHHVAAVNPVSAFLAAARNLLAGRTGGISLGFALAGCVALALGVWALRGLRKAEESI